ncbi:TonB-dependent hemoglobin/transferrin/lactoferrin family receptor [Porphyrobacter sp. ULC335]|uniref:TonB-dependent hemoglobin/transferrin/lactoferrin family receptor n=1 Tax=Porphyrobacter sp. ULC335 TaxID=2854260 RepID=UPI00222070BA|nr:TonB-dependent hemoglobin/transferrin/lactoferrin family receptor [Porphyrobacter sp. ULC335]UYV15519.1 TonB-dependent hemoglobin/transferrin/lactoferrin family receptor [Porphyrobacter sp. ULC335]
MSSQPLTHYALSVLLTVGATGAASAAETGLSGAEGSAEAPPQTGRITVTATRAPVLQEEAPATVTIITDEDIADQLATDVKDLVRFEPGVSVRRAPARFGAAIGATGRARNEDFAVRGIGGNRVLIQVDGIRSPQGFSFGPQDAGRGGFADVSLVKQVEILRGPASALYGSDGLAGAISFVTSDPVDIIAGADLGGFVNSQYSSDDNEFAQTATLAGQTGNLSAMIAYTRRDFSELENRGTTGGTGPSRTAPNPQDGRSDAVLAKIVWDNGPHRIRLTGEWLDSAVETGVLTGLGPAFTFGPNPVWTVDALNARDTNQRKRASVDWTYDGTPDDVIEYAFVSAFWQDAEDRQFAFEERTTLTATPAPDRERLNTFENRVYGAAGEARSSFDLAGMRHRIAIGGDISWTRQEGLRDGTFPGRGESFPTRAFPATDFTLGGMFIADEITLLDGALTLFPALRFDFYDLNPTDDPLLTAFTPQGQSANRLSPKFGATVKLAPDVILFGNYAQGFLAPTPSQVNNFFEFIAGGYTSIPNPDLRPETSESWEVGARYVGEVFSLQLTGFRGDYDNFINQQVVSGGFTPQNPAIFQFVNFDGARIEGVEARAEMKLSSGFNARFAMAYADGDTIDPAGVRTPLDTIDPFNLVASLGYRAPSGRFGGELILTHNARKERGELERAANGSDLFVRPDASTILDLTAFYAVTDALKLRAGLFNLTNETYALWSDVRGLSVNDAGIFDAFTRPGRNLSLSASYRF